MDTPRWLGGEVRRRHGRARGQSRVRPRLESLEGRTLLTLSFAPAVGYEVGGQPDFVAVGDFDGDGATDLATTNVYGTRGVSVLLNLDDGTFGPAAGYSAGDNPESVAVGDFDGDGRPDLAAANLSVDSFGDVGVLLNTTVNNQPPTDISLSSVAVAENQPAGITVGQFSTADPDAGDSFVYRLIAGPGDADNALFAIGAGGILRTTAAFNYEARSSYSIRVRSTDALGESVEKAFIITVTDVNEAPTDITLSHASVAENQAAGATVGTLDASDPDTTLQGYSFQLVSGAVDNTLFAIDRGRLTTAASFDYESRSSYTVRVQVTDRGGLSTTKDFAIAVTDTNDAPVLDNAGTMELAEIVEDQVNNAGTLVSTIIASAGGDRITDQDAGAVEGIAVVAVDNSRGAWQFSTDDGRTWAAFGTPSNAAARLLAADATTRIRFAPSRDFSGIVEPGITFRAWDRTSGSNGAVVDATANGGTTAFSVAAETARIRVLSPLDLVDRLLLDVRELMGTGALNDGQGDSLLTKLQQARTWLIQGRKATSINLIQAFINEVQDLMDTRVLTTEQGQPLIDRARAAVTAIAA
jgi:hypothetical protein